MGGDYVVVNVSDNGRILRLSARIGVVDEKEYEGVFLQKISGRVSAEQNDSIFVLQ